VVSVAVAGRGFEQFFDGDERCILRNLDTFFYELTRSFTPPAIATWNGEEFDLPFLHARYARCGVAHGLELFPLGARRGKYGKPTYAGVWCGLPSVDVSPWYQAFAQSRGIRHSLKPVAKALGYRPIEVPDRGSTTCRTRGSRATCSSAVGRLSA
jgi:DNA polymerase elongation subunit (family B)